MTRLAALLLVVGAAAPAAAQTRVPDPPADVDLRPVSVRFRGNVEGLRVRLQAELTNARTVGVTTEVRRA